MSLNEQFQGLSVDRTKKKRRPRPEYIHQLDLPATFASPQPSAFATPQPSTLGSPQLSAFGTPQPGGTPQFSTFGSPQQSHVPTPAPHEESPTSDLSVSEARYKAQLEYLTPNNEGTFASFLTFTNVIPPLAGTQYHSVDQGTASAKFIRPTLYNVPETEQLRAATKLPMAVTVRPFAPLLETEAPVPTVDLSQVGAHEGADPFDVGPPRCRRCRTYINPSMQHSERGTFECNICRFPNNACPSDYAAAIDPRTGYRVDHLARPELHRGVYDIIVPKHYNVKPEEPNQPLHHLFLIDISEHSTRALLPTLAAESIRATLYNGETPFQGKIAIVTYDKRLQFYNLSPLLDTCQVSVLADLDDPFVPFCEGLFVDPEESRPVIEDALTMLEAMNSDTAFAEPEPCFAAACRYALECLEQVGGGKVTAVLSALPSWGPGALKFKDNRHVGKTSSPEVEKKVFLPDSDYYKLLAKDFLKASVGLDVLVVSPQAVDLLNVGWLANVTGGQVYKWSNFNLERDGRTFTSRFVNSARHVSGYQGQFKLRCSNGLQVAQYYGTSSSVAETNVVGGTLDPVIPTLNPDQAFTVLLKFDGSLDTKYDCHLQAAMLYTDPHGVRKVRVINLVLAVSERLEDVFHFALEDAVVTTIIKDTLSFVGQQPLVELRDSINEKLVEVFTQYRAMYELGNHKPSPKKMIFPESLNHLPVYLLSFLKNKVIRDALGIPADARLHELFQLMYMPVERLVFRLYPALIELHSLTEAEGYYVDDAAGTRYLSLPHYKDLSLKLLEFGVYIMCDGDSVYVWVHQNANLLLIKDLFGDVESVSQLDPLMDELPELDTEISVQARNLVEYFQAQVIGASPTGSKCIQLIRQGLDRSEEHFKELLVEDSLRGAIKATSGPSYSDYIMSLHKAVRVKLDNDKSSNKVRSLVNLAEHPDTLAQRLIHF